MSSSVPLGPPRRPVFYVYTSAMPPLGASLVLLAAPLAWIVRDLMSGGQSPVFAALVLVFGTALVLNPNAMRQGQFEASLAELAPLTVYLFVIALLCLLPLTANGSPEGGKSMGIAPVDLKGLAETLIMMAFMVGMFTHRLETFRNLPAYFSVFGTVSICALIAAAVSSQSLLISLFVGARLGGVGEENQASAPITPATIAALTLAGTVIWLRSAPQFRILPALHATLAIPACVATLIASRSRTVFVGVVLAMMVMGFAAALRRRFFGGKNGPIAEPGWSKGLIAYTLFMIALLVFILFQFRVFDNVPSTIRQVSLIFEDTGEFVWNAIEALVLGNANADASTAQRMRQVTFALETLTLWGHGYKAYYIDVPLLQAFYDLGLIGGCFYVLTFVLIPLRVVTDLLLNDNSCPVARLGIAAYLIIFPRFFFAGEPYWYTTVLVVIFFYATSVRYWSRPLLHPNRLSTLTA